MLKYTIAFGMLILIELLYFKVADKLDIIDKPNQRSSHTRIVLRGGGIVFLFGVWIWSILFGFAYPWMLVAVTLAALVSFVDDIHSLPDRIRLGVQFVAMAFLIHQLGLLQWSNWWMAIVALIVAVGATNIYNFMDGINGITAGYSLAVLLPLAMLDKCKDFVASSLIWVVILSLLVFSFFNFRPKNKAKCFAGDVGSVGIAFIILFCIGMLIVKTGDICWLVLLVVYGIDGCLTICHRILLHENLGQAHRKHAYQLMANELGMSHVSVSIIYMVLQLAISLVMIFLIPDTFASHIIYLVSVVVILSALYVLFMKKFYHLHEEYLDHVN